MNIGNLFSKNMSLIMGIISGKMPDTGKILSALGDVITDENVKSVVLELHRKYAAECMKLQPGHYLKIVLEPDSQKGLGLAFWDFAPDGTATKCYDTLYLAEISADMLQQIIQQLFAPQDVTPELEDQLDALKEINMIEQPKNDKNEH